MNEVDRYKISGHEDPNIWLRGIKSKALEILSKHKQIHPDDFIYEIQKEKCCKISCRDTFLKIYYYPNLSKV